MTVLATILNISSLVTRIYNLLLKQDTLYTILNNNDFVGITYN